MKRILVRAPNWIGDQILAFPFFYELRRRFPKSWIGVVCTPWVKDLQYLGLVDEVISIPRRSSMGWMNVFNWVLAARREIKKSGDWDLGITLPNSFGSALLFYLSGVRNIRGYRADARGLILNQALDWDQSPSLHRSDSYLGLLPNFDRHASSKTADIYREFDAVRFWSVSEPTIPPKENFFVVAPGATANSRRWMDTEFSELIRIIQSRTNWTAVLVGGKSEKMLAERIVRSAHGGRILDYTGSGTVASLWKVFSQAQVTFCNESGLAHVASICGSKVQIICGAANPVRTKPLERVPSQVSIVANPVECWPCERNKCSQEGSKYLQCLRGIDAR